MAKSLTSQCGQICIHVRFQTPASLKKHSRQVPRQETLDACEPNTLEFDDTAFFGNESSAIHLNPSQPITYLAAHDT